MNQETNPIARSTDVVMQKLDDEILIYDLKKHKAICLNRTAALVWQSCDGLTSIGEIRESLSAKLNTEISDDFIWLAIDELQKEGLLENFQCPPGIFSGLTRREVIKKVGLTSMVALPIISAVVAPTKTQAQSCVGPNMSVGNPVTSGPLCDAFDNECCSGNAIPAFGCGPSCVTCRCA